MTKQELARARNINKWLLSGSFKPYNTTALTAVEIDLINLINRTRKQLLEHWDKNTELLGFNVPAHRCYHPNCKNKVKYRYEETGQYACKKHATYSDRLTLIDIK